MERKGIFSKLLERSEVGLKGFLFTGGGMISLPVEKKEIGGRGTKRNLMQWSGKTSSPKGNVS